MQLKQLSPRKKALNCILFAVIPAFLFYASSLVGLKVSGLDIIEIIRDPAQQSGESSFLGFVSNIGIWLWISAAAICLFSVKNNGFRIKSNQRGLLSFMGALSMTLAIDDFFLIHDRYVNQNFCYLLYMVLAVGMLVRHYREILRIDAGSFLLAGSLLALSILADLSQGHIPLPYIYIQVFEEGFKFVGAAIWLYFGCRVASFHPSSSVE